MHSFKIDLFEITLSLKFKNISKLLIANNDDHNNIIMALNLFIVVKQWYT